ncbi:hypothetical protein H206_02389 [Candidatus Electrothrix aarhusensis]|uniref:Uncharacterized protein n=1 Tax=Candidatus Electrothrix aarhusensis TaxID=1859131 RepID=A0A444IWR6_9BACT|nr:hypothetical protein H206_02389 [Candidatus Electrothrix aarhusensis]
MGLLKKKTIILFSAILMAITMSGMAYAVADVSSAEVMMIGTNPGAGGDGASSIKIQLKNISGGMVGTDWADQTTRFFFLTTEQGDTGMATLLTALSLDKPVWARLAGAAENNSLCQIIYLSK